MDREVGSGCLKAWKNDKVLLGNDLAQMEGEISGI